MPDAHAIFSCRSMRVLVGSFSTQWGTSSGSRDSKYLCSCSHGAGRKAGCEGQSRAREEAGSSKRECFRSGGGAEEEGQTLEEHGRRIMAIHVHGSTSRVHPVPGRGPADPRPDGMCPKSWPRAHGLFHLLKALTSTFFYNLIR